MRKFICAILMAALLCTACGAALADRLPGWAAVLGKSNSTNTQAEPTVSPTAKPTAAPTAAPQTPADAPLLPDPAGYVNAAGVLMAEDMEMEGGLYDVYGYEFMRTEASTAGSAMDVYMMALQVRDFECEKISETYDEDEWVYTYWYGLSKNGVTAYLAYEAKLIGRACTMMLCVPQGMEFVLDEVAEGNTLPFYNAPLYDDIGENNSFYNDSLYDDDDSSYYDSWSADDDTVVCTYCHGSKTCPNCYGSGQYRNPYTGDYLDCTCGNGKCPICDGKGVW